MHFCSGIVHASIAGTIVFCSSLAFFVAIFNFFNMTSMKTSQNAAPRVALEVMNRLCLFLQAYTPFLWDIFDTFLLFACALARLGSGGIVAIGADKSHRPEQPLVLYDSHNDPDSRLVRETLSVLDIDFVCYPCPKESLSGDGQPLNSRYRVQLMKTGGLLKVPLLVDRKNENLPIYHLISANKSTKLYFADNIIPYLWKTYGDKAVAPKNYTLAHHPAFRHVSLFVCQLLRPCMWMGILRAPSRKPEMPLELWGFEPSPYVKRVTEVLTTLELPFVMRTIPRKSTKRPDFRSSELDLLPGYSSRPEGQIQVPMLRDPNNGDLRMLESRKIADYLITRYQTYPVSGESWLQSDGEGPEFSHCAVAMTAVLALVAPPLLAVTYVGACVLRMV